MLIPKDIIKIILSFLFKCDNCNLYSCGKKRRCRVCYPHKMVCNDCFFITGLNHMSSTICNECGITCCSIHNSTALYYIPPNNIQNHCIEETVLSLTLNE